MISIPDSTVVLDRTVMLLEYGSCRDPVQAALLFQQRESESLHRYLSKGWLKLGFDEQGKESIRACEQVGLLPFSVGGQSRLLMIAPKGCQQNENEELGLRRFLELLVLSEGDSPPEDMPGWEGRMGPFDEEGVGHDEFKMDRTNLAANEALAINQKTGKEFYGPEAVLPGKNLDLSNISIADAERLRSSKDVEEIGQALVMTIPQLKLKLVIGPVYQDLRFGLFQSKYGETLHHYRVVRIAPSDQSSKLLADAYVNEPRQLQRLGDTEEALTKMLHTVPFGAAADYGINGHGTLGEAILSTADGAALLTGVGGVAFKSTRLMVTSLTLQGGGIAYRGVQLAQAVGSKDWKQVAGLSEEIVVRLLFAKGTYNGYQVILKNKTTTPISPTTTPTSGPGRPTTSEPIPPAPKPAYKFESMGISYESEITTAANGATEIEHFITHNGQRQPIGLSSISKNGELTHSFQVPKEFRELGISERAYAEANKVGFKSLETSFNAGADQVNFNKFREFYDSAKENAAEALLQTPAGKVAKKYGLKPTNIRITETNVSATWIKE